MEQLSSTAAATCDFALPNQDNTEHDLRKHTNYYNRGTFILKHNNAKATWLPAGTVLTYSDKHGNSRLMLPYSSPVYNYLKHT